MSKIRSNYVFLHYRSPDYYFEFFLFCELISIITTGLDIFKIVEYFIFSEKDLVWTDCIKIYSDGALAMLRS